MALFNDTIATAPEPEYDNEMPKAGTYPGEVAFSEVRDSRAGAPYFVIGYELESHPFPVQEWLAIPQGAPSSWSREERPTKSGKGTTSDFEQNTRSASNLKKRLLDLGVPQERISQINEGDLDGIKVVVTTAVQRDNPDYRRVRKVAVPGSSGATLPGAPAAPVAQAAPTSVSDSPWG